ncbi:alpha-isopropylmalate synthase regulatory domain-containing protein [Rhodococcoides kyotonense]|uniref:LeuA allosteric (Dimerisation) domain-containing protein n=1 Tax=Rhodococcoides kyotonense TaxID=398843 RepID=A0A239NCH8_9NOCA|nr:alpha-isopropylmalate synthase regulatory domain-containing protein [Rhodococcus kyotonensis]SNT52193.1 LeuA allosteric (dimerisation) domain-containing protein [Rhodococcus kyotonensis]
MNALIENFLSTDCFAARYGSPLPRELRIQAGDMNWTTFTQHFSSTTGPIRLGSWDSTATRGGRTRFDATFGIDDAIHTASATTYGPVDALTSMLYDCGFHIEILEFHQQSLTEGTTATFVHCELDGHREWSMAIEPDAVLSSIRAIIGAANMLHYRYLPHVLDTDRKA